MDGVNRSLKQRVLVSTQNGDFATTEFKKNRKN